MHPNVLTLKNDSVAPPRKAPNLIPYFSALATSSLTLPKSSVFSETVSTAIEYAIYIATVTKQNIHHAAAKTRAASDLEIT